MNNTPPQPKAKKPKVTTYLLRNLSKDDLNRMFYEGYDEKFFYSKALALHHIINLAENEQEPLRQHAEEGVQAK